MPLLPPVLSCPFPSGPGCSDSNMKLNYFFPSFPFQYFRPCTLKAALKVKWLMIQVWNAVAFRISSLGQMRDAAIVCPLQECRLNRASNTDLFQTRIEKALSSNQCLSRDKFSKKPNFIISHYAGKVCYQLAAMVEKNKVGNCRKSCLKKS